jgi:hypothetical protein
MRMQSHVAAVYRLWDKSHFPQWGLFLFQWCDKERNTGKPGLEMTYHCLGLSQALVIRSIHDQCLVLFSLGPPGGEGLGVGGWTTWSQPHLGGSMGAGMGLIKESMLESVSPV